MKRGMFAILTLVTVLVTLPMPVRANFHLAVIDEVMTSYNGDTNAQFVEIRMLAGGQTVVSGSVLATFDATGAYIADVLTVTGNLANGGAGVRWLMGTSAYALLPGAPAPNFMFANNSLPTTGGMVCWGKPSPGHHNDPNKYVDCIAYGSYTGPSNNNVCRPSWSDADGHSVVRTGDGTDLLNDTTCGDPITPQNNSGTTTSLTAMPACPAAPPPNHDTVLAPLAPLNVTIPASGGPVTKTVKVKVTNADVTCGNEMPGHNIVVAAPILNGCAPGIIVSGPDFDSTTGGDQTSVVLAGGKSKSAKFVLSIAAGNFTSFNRKAADRCSLMFSADTDVVGNVDPNPTNNAAPLEISVIDKTDPEGTAVHESYIKAMSPKKITIPKSAASKSLNASFTAGNADISPPEPAGHSVTATQSDGDCPAATVGQPDFDATTGGTQPTATVKGGATKGGKAAVTATTTGFSSPNAKSPHRCTASINVAGPGGDSEGSNDASQLVIDVIDKNDF